MSDQVPEVRARVARSSPIEIENRYLVARQQNLVVVEVSVQARRVLEAEGEGASEVFAETLQARAQVWP